MFFCTPWESAFGLAALDSPLGLRCTGFGLGGGLSGASAMRLGSDHTSSGRRSGRGEASKGVHFIIVYIENRVQLRDLQ